MATMKAALWDGKKMQLKQLERPEPGPGDAVVKLRSSGICGSDLLIYYDKKTPETIPAGHELAGEIVAVGPGVDKKRVGERVALDNIGAGRGCMQCWYCRTGQYFLCDKPEEDRGGGFAEYTVVRAAGCFPMHDNLSWEEGALTEPLAVAVHAVRRGELTGGETVAVLGSGTIGLNCIAAARALGAGKIIATARHPQQVEMARKLGADAAVSSEGTVLKEALADITDGRGADLTIEAVGGRSDDVLKQAIDVTRQQGRISTTGNFWRPVQVDWFQALLKEQSWIWAAVYGILDGRHDYEIALDLMASGRANMKQIVTHTVGLDDIQKGVEISYNKKQTGAIKVQVLQ
ncbi:MAG: zinc-binding dehydrogenase [Chloroflexi bacterium]|nr:zinc-binding dehydrogenase [Chloroflexota bacterium]